MYDHYGSIFLLAIVSIPVARKLWDRVRLSLAKYPSLAGHSRWSRRVARLVPYFEYDLDMFFRSDGCDTETAALRKRSMESLGRRLRERCPRSIGYTDNLRSVISDLQFTNAYRVPFPFRSIARHYLDNASVAVRSQGVEVLDLDGNRSIDLSGSYGVNLFGYDFYKECMDAGAKRARALGPVLGPYHPSIRFNVERLTEISGLDEVSFHMSGTEAVMQAVRLARYHTGRKHLVRFCGAYHGWWDGVQPGVGNQRPGRDILTLSDVSAATLRVLETRRDIACVLVNPLQALHPNRDASSDSTLISSARSAGFDREAYTRWLRQLREVCTRRGIVLIFDEVFTGFRLAYRGAQEYFGVQADIVTYGKTVAGGLPIGVVCGTHDLMRRYRDDQPANVSFARGTFNSHPYVMATMQEFLRRLERPGIKESYLQLETTWNHRAASLNERLARSELPVRVANLVSIWTVLYELPGRYNWMFQYYLREQGLMLSWVGTGRLIFSHNFSADDFDEVASRFLRAAENMRRDGWWWYSPDVSNRTIERTMLGQMLVARLSNKTHWTDRKATAPRHSTCQEREPSQ